MDILFSSSLKSKNHFLSYHPAYVHSFRLLSMAFVTCSDHSFAVVSSLSSIKSIAYNNIFLLLSLAEYWDREDLSTVPTSLCLTQNVKDLIPLAQTASHLIRNTPPRRLLNACLFLNISCLVHQCIKSLSELQHICNVSVMLLFLLLCRLLLHCLF